MFGLSICHATMPSWTLTKRKSWIFSLTNNTFGPSTPITCLTISKGLRLLSVWPRSMDTSRFSFTKVSWVVLNRIYAKRLRVCEIWKYEKVNTHEKPEHCKKRELPSCLILVGMFYLSSELHTPLPEPAPLLLTPLFRANSFTNRQIGIDSLQKLHACSIHISTPVLILPIKNVASYGAFRYTKLY